MEYKFDDLLDQAIQDWPAEVEMNDIVVSGSNSERFSVKRLGELHDAISERYIGSGSEVIFRSLHQSIYEVLHAAAVNVTRVTMMHLRRASIQGRLEKHLKVGVDTPEIGYSAEDVEVVRKYFEANAK